MPELPDTFDDTTESTEDDQSLTVDTKSVGETTSDRQKAADYLVQRSIDDAQDEWSLTSQPNPQWVLVFCWWHGLIDGWHRFSSQSRTSEQPTNAEKIQVPVDEQHLDSDNQGKSSTSLLSSITSAFSAGIERIQENIRGKPETPSASEDLSVELASQATANDEQHDEKDKQISLSEKETNSRTTSSSPDETFSSDRQSKQLQGEERSADVDSGADNKNQVIGRSTSSALHEEEKLVQDNKSSPRSSVDIENKFSSANTAAESPQSIIASEKQINDEDISEDKEEPVSAPSSSTTETITSIDQQPSSDSLIDIVRQIGIQPHIPDLSSRSIKTDLTVSSTEDVRTSSHDNIPQEQDELLKSVSHVASHDDIQKTEALSETGVERLAKPLTDNVDIADDQKRSEDTSVTKQENAQQQSM